MVLKTRTKKTSATRAEAMGRRAGVVLRDLGIPTRCPFTQQHPAELRRAWARGYVAGQSPRP